VLQSTLSPRFKFSPAKSNLEKKCGPHDSGVAGAIALGPMSRPIVYHRLYGTGIPWPLRVGESLDADHVYQREHPQRWQLGPGACRAALFKFWSLHELWLAPHFPLRPQLPRRWRAECQLGRCVYLGYAHASHVAWRTPYLRGIDGDGEMQPHSTLQRAVVSTLLTTFPIMYIYTAQ
jgi:hypothetical protein